VVDVASGTSTALVGDLNGQYGATDGLSATFLNPHGLALDGAGKLYIAEVGNSELRVVDIAAKNTSTLAGNVVPYGSSDGPAATATWSSPYDVAIDSSGLLYVADLGGRAVRTLSLGPGGTASTFAGLIGSGVAMDGTGLGARFGAPYALTLDGTGNLYVSDSNAVRTVTVPGAVVSTNFGKLNQTGYVDLAGAAARFANAGPGGLVVAGGKIYVADGLNNVIRVIDPGSMAVTTFAGSLTKQAGSQDGTGNNAQFYRPTGITTDGVGHLFVADSNNGTIRQIDIASAMVSTLAGTALALGNMDGIGAAARFVNPYGIEWDKNGSLYVADRSAQTIRRVYVATGAVSTFAGSLGQGGVVPGSIVTATLNGPTAVRVSPSGALVVACSLDNAIVTITQQ
jgi:sugar lactone lactonase YvrE